MNRERVIELEAEDEADALAMAEYLAGESFVSAEIVQPPSLDEVSKHD